MIPGGTADTDGRLTARVVESLASFTDEQLDRATADAGVFFDRRWFRLLDALDLAPMLRGAVTFRYVVVASEGEPVALCPLFIARSRDIHFAYSADKLFFTSWQDELLRINPDMARFIGWLSRITLTYRRIIEAAGVRADNWVLAVSPLTFRSSIAVAPMSAGARRRARAAVVDALKEIAREERAPLWFCRVAGEETDLRRDLEGAGLDELFMVHDNVIEDTGSDLTEYLRRFTARARSNFNREIARTRRAGVRFEVTTQMTSAGPDLTRLYEAMYSKYGPEYFFHPDSFWGAIEEHLGAAAECIMAYRANELVGFSLLLNKGDLWAYRAGRKAVRDQDEESRALYFNLAFYEPLRRAAALGARRLWLGPGAWDTKHHRGALGHPLYGYFWFPGVRHRAALLPYMKIFAHVSQRQMDFVTRPSGNIKVVS